MCRVEGEPLQFQPYLQKYLRRQGNTNHPTHFHKFAKLVVPIHGEGLHGRL